MTSLEIIAKEQLLLTSDEPNDTKFNRLLKNSVFVDYFNTFLSLPIFGTRLTYKADREKFEIDPPVRRTKYHVIHPKIKTWVRNKRAPLFWKTDLYIQFLLCDQMMVTNEDISEISIKTYLGSVSSMRNFRVFLRGTRGERLFAFWMDAERYRRQVRPENRRFVFREIQSNYLNDGSANELPEEIKWKAFQTLTGVKISHKSLDTDLSLKQRDKISIFSKDIFVPAVIMAVQRLRNYWVPQYILHIETQKRKTRSQWKMIVELCKEVEYTGDAPLSRILKTLTKRHGGGERQNINRITVVREDCRESTETLDEKEVDTFLEMNRVSSTESLEEEKFNTEEERMKRLEDWRQWFWGPVDNKDDKVVDIKLPKAFPDYLLHLGAPTVQKKTSDEEDVKKSTLLDGEKHEKGKDESKPDQVPQTLPTINETPSPPTKTTFKLSSPGRSRSTTPRSQESPPQLPEIQSSFAVDIQPKTFDNKPKQLYAMATRSTLPPHRPRADRFLTLYEALREKSVSPFPGVVDTNERSEKNTEFEGKMKKISTLESIRRTSQALIVQQQIQMSTSDFENLFKEPRIAFSQGYLEQQYKLKDSVSSLILSAAIASDKLAGSPLMKYMLSINDRRGIKCLQFWEDVQRYLMPTSYFETHSKYRMAKTLVATYIKQGSPREIPLASKEREELSRLLPIEEADALLSKAVKNTTRELLLPWGEFAQMDINNFLSFVTRPKQKPRFVKEKKPIKSSIKKKDKDVMSKEEEEEAKELARTSDRRKSRVMEAFGSAAVVTLPEFELDDEDVELENLEDILEMLKRRREIEMQRAFQFESKNASQRRGSHFYGQTKAKEEGKETDKKSAKGVSMGKSRPPRPRNFQDVLFDPHQLLWFKRFLSDHHSDAPLHFWQAVENMKNNTRDAKARQARSSAIVRKYFVNINSPANEYLQCKAEIIKEIPVLPKVTPPLLLSAQACVAKSLEENWFIKYLATFPEEDTDSEYFSKYAMRNTLAGVCKIASYGKTRGLWVMFAQSIMSFQRGIHNQSSLSEFKRFLRKEHRTTVEHNTKRHSLHPNRRMINNKFINTDRLVNDLEFWLEVEKFRGMADNANECAKAGNYNADDEKLILFKARTIIRCFVNSEMPPRIRINISNDLAEQILGLYETGIVERGLFHEASMSVFTSLIHFWKKFSAERDQGKTTPADEKDTSKKGEKKIDKKPISYICGLPYRQYSVGPDEDFRWTFSLMYGLRFIVPTQGKFVVQRRGTVQLPNFGVPTET